MSQSHSLLQQAKQGNPKAIAALVNKSLQSHGIKVIKSIVKQKCLHFMLEAKQFPKPEKLVQFIQSSLTKINISNIENVKIYGCHKGDDFPSWNYEFNLKKTNGSNQNEYQSLIVQAIKSSLGNNNIIQIRERQDNLIIMLKSEKYLEKHETCKVIQNNLSSLEIKRKIKFVKIYFQKTDEEFPDWHYEYEVDRATEDLASSTTQIHDSETNSEQNLNLTIQIKKLSYELFEKLHFTFLKPVVVRLQFLSDVSDDPDISSGDDIVRGLNLESLRTELKESMLHSSRMFKDLIIKYSLDCSNFREDIKIIFDSLNIQLEREIKENLDSVNSLGQNYLEIQEEELSSLGQAMKGAVDGAVQSFNIWGGIIGAVQGYQGANQRTQEMQQIEQEYVQARDVLFENIFSFWRQVYVETSEFLDRKLGVPLISYQDIKDKIGLYEEKFEKAVKFLNSGNAEKAIVKLESARNLFWEKTIPLFADRIILKNLHGNEILQDRIFIWGNTYLKNKNLEQAKYFYEMIRDKYTNISDAQLGLACVYSLGNDLDQSLSCINFAVEEGFCNLSILDLMPELVNLRASEEYDLLFKNACKSFSPTEINYTKLMELLSQQKWKGADILTWKLMCKSIKKEDKSTFSNDDIAAFSLIDLENIDYLWLKYSDNKYGFSIQKRIYDKFSDKLAEDFTLLTNKLRWPEDFGDESYNKFFSELQKNPQKQNTKGLLPYLIHYKGSGFFSSDIFMEIMEKFGE